jgi:hypothetical protein
VNLIVRVDNHPEKVRGMNVRKRVRVVLKEFK